MSVAQLAVTLDCHWQRHVRARTVFVVVVLLFAVLNVYRSTTLTPSPSSSHEFSHRQQQQRWLLLPAADRANIGESSNTNRSATRPPPPDVDQLLLVRSVREQDYPAYNMTVATGEVRAVPLWQRRLWQRHPNRSANAAIEDDIVGPYYFLTELLQVQYRLTKSLYLL